MTESERCFLPQKNRRAMKQRDCSGSLIREDRKYSVRFSLGRLSHTEYFDLQKNS
jgi:hypothetical protein